jgi:hypothetical protein
MNVIAAQIRRAVWARGDGLEAAPELTPVRVAEYCSTGWGDDNPVEIL